MTDARESSEPAGPVGRGFDLPQLDASDRMFSIGLVTVVLSLVSGLATYLILTGLTPITPRDEIVAGALLTNIALIVAMIGILAWQSYGLWQAWKKNVPGARLHVRIVGLFSIIAALPAIVLAIAATTTFSRAIDSWFTQRTREIVNNALEVAQSYLDEHGQVIRTDVANMARDIDASADEVAADADAMRRVLITQASLRDLPVAYIVDSKGDRLIAAYDTGTLTYIRPPGSAIAEAANGQIAIIKSAEYGRVAAVAKLQKIPDRFLYVARGVSQKVMGHLLKTEQSVEEYNKLGRGRSGLKLAHGLMYTTISMTALLAAIWAGLWFAGRFVAPIRRLIAGAREVSEGNLDVELPERRGEGDLRRLSHTFNTMTRELKHQRDALVSANEQLLERRRFMEAVLSGVSAGVIGVDSEGRITLLSRSAEALLGLKASEATGKRLVDAIPAFAEALAPHDGGMLKPRGVHDVRMMVGPEERTFSVRVTEEREGGVFLLPAAAIPVRDIPESTIKKWIAEDERGAETFWKNAGKA